jgi:guanylate kinase
MEKIKKDIVCIIAPSGCGKGTIVKYLLNTYVRFCLSISATTRSPRGNEKDGVEYWFKTLEQFKQDIEDEKLVEYVKVYEGKYYGTYKSELERIKNLGKIALLDIDYEGALLIEKEYGDRVLTIGLLPPGLPSTDILEKRLRKRGSDNDNDIIQRLIRVPKELLYITTFDHVIVNDDLQETYHQVDQVLEENGIILINKN